MYIQLKDKDNFKSGVLYIHCDTEEFLAQINKWLVELKDWVASTVYSGMPLSRFDPEVAMVDLIWYLCKYYDETSMLREKGRIIGTFRLVPYSVADKDITTILLN